MPPSRAVEPVLTTRECRFATELEFSGETNLRSAHLVNERIKAMRMELEDAHRSVRTLIAMARLTLEELE